MNRSTLKSRLDRSGQRVLCGAPFGRCRGQIGWVGPHPMENGQSRVWWLPQGWARRSDGVYYMAEYARRNIKRGFDPKHPHHFGRAKMDTKLGYDKVLLLFPRLPCFAECPDCRRSLILDPDELDVEAAPLKELELDSVPSWYLDQQGGPHRVDRHQLPPLPPNRSIVIMHPDGTSERRGIVGAAPDAE